MPIKSNKPAVKLFGGLKKAEPQPAPEAKPGGKGRPTPKRKEAEAVHKRPLGGAGVKGGPAAKPLTKEQQKAERAKARERFDLAMKTGDERYLPARDKGPVRRWTRDYIDSRRSIGEYIVFVALGSLILLFFLIQTVPVVASIVMLLMYVVLIAVIADAVIRGRKLRKALIAKFGEDKLPKGSVWYGINRSLQMRRTRMPNPQVKRGEFPS
ncbi:MAG: DUF3043 domain-containing protein [Bifidobacteriaceae bacterium]|nr:DUF3043 domain-containing protein [Bifidobacteriaceae bacterium]